jgi:hypothetical protein
MAYLPSSVIVRDLNVEGVASGPAEADSPLVVDPNAVLPLSISPQPLQSVPRGHPEVIDPFRGVQEQKFAVRPTLYIRWQQPRPLSPEDLLRLSVREASDHSAR